MFTFVYTIKTKKLKMVNATNMIELTRIKRDQQGMQDQRIL